MNTDELNLYLNTIKMPSRQLPHQTTCHTCDESFSGEKAWNQKLDHLHNLHGIRGHKTSREAPDPELVAWAAEAGFIQRNGDRWMLSFKKGKEQSQEVGRGFGKLNGASRSELCGS